MSDATGDESDIVFLCRTQYPWHWNERSEWSQETVSAHNVTVNIARAAADEIERLQSRLSEAEKNWENDVLVLETERDTLVSRLHQVIAKAFDHCTYCPGCACSLRTEQHRAGCIFVVERQST